MNQDKPLEILNLKPKEVALYGNQLLEFMSDIMPTILLKRYAKDEEEEALFLKKREEMLEDMVILQCAWAWHYRADLKKDERRQQQFQQLLVQFNDAYARMTESVYFFNNIRKERYELALQRTRAANA